MKTRTLLVAGLLLLGSLAAAPAASADHIPCPSDEPTLYAACQTANSVAHGAEDRIVCLLTTGVVFWLSDCFNDVT